jgi:drug/metabolite transporter (DMT)-like permease
MENKKVIATLFACLAAVFYAINIPMSKLLLIHITPTFMASFLYFGAEQALVSYIYWGEGKHEETKKTYPERISLHAWNDRIGYSSTYLLMIGLTSATSANASLLNNFEIVATSLIALIVFKEFISVRLWIAILLITLSSMLLSFEDVSSFRFSYGSLFVLAAAICWGFENNFTRKLSTKNTYQIVILKGMFSGLVHSSLR